MVDPFIGKITLFKVNSGVLRKDMEVLNPNKNKKERIAQVMSLMGNKQIEVEELRAGDIGATTKLQYTQTGDTLCQKERSEEHTSELQSRQYLVCRLLLEKKKK